LETIFLAALVAFIVLLAIAVFRQWRWIFSAWSSPRLAS
jgi:hypothetical protein